MPDGPDPESLPTLNERREAAGHPDLGALGPAAPDRPAVRRRPAVVADAGQQARAASQQVWIRANGEMPDDPLLHVCAVTYASDMTLLDSVLLANGLAWDDNRKVMVASLDHAMWFHRPFRADDWLLYDQQSPSASGARGLAIGRLFTRDGRHVVSVVQEGLLRVVGGIEINS